MTYQLRYIINFLLINMFFQHNAPAFAAVPDICSRERQKYWNQLIKEAQQSVPLHGVGRWVPVGDCTRKALKRGLIMSSTKTYSSTVDAENRVDCLRLQKMEEERGCACGKIGVAHAPSEQLEESIRDSYRRVRALERAALRGGIQNKFIRSYVSEVNRLRDCVHEDVLRILQQTEKQLGDVLPHP